MKRAVNTVVVMVMAAALAAGCQTFGGRSGELAIDDNTLTGSVKSKLVSERGSNLTLVDVASKKGTVYLNGEVESPTHKARAEELAWQVAGVRNVINNLQISSEGAGSPAQPETSDPFGSAP